MYKFLVTGLGGVLLATLVTIAGAADWEYPVIKDAGPVINLPKAAVQPVTNIDYKILFDIMGWPEMQGTQVPGLFSVAQVINTFAIAGTQPDKLNLALVLHGKATESVLQAQAFQDRHGFANPNLKLISELRKLGVTLYVCGQALAAHDIASKDVNPAITIALSAHIVVPTYQLQGYAFMPFY